MFPAIHNTYRRRSRNYQFPIITTSEEDDVFINPDGFEKISTPESCDDDEMDFDNPGLSGSSRAEDSDVESEIDPPEWELGIRRSSKAKNSKVEDLTLSDIILDPDGNITYYWQALVTMSVVYNIIVIILRLAFSEMREEAIQDYVFYFLDTIGDLMYTVDIFVHLRVSFYEDGCLVLSSNRIMERYTRSRIFMIDLLSVIPLGTVYMLVSGFSRIINFYPPPGCSGDIYIVLARLPRLLKYSTMVKFFDSTDSRTRNPNFIRAFKLSLNLWVVIHWIGCVYYMISEYEGLGSNDWVYPASKDLDFFSRKYIRVMYWSLMTLTTIGERPAPESDLEFVFTGLTFLIGVFVFAAVVGNVGDVISNMNASRQEFQSRMDHIKFYLQHRNVDERLQSRVKRWADYTWTRTQAIDEPTLLQMLPERLRTEIAINVHLETLKKVKIFEECEEGLLRELVLKLRPQLYSPGDYICRIGEIGKEMYIVNHGKVDILVPNSQTARRTVVATLSSGNYFGEISLLKLDDGQNRRTADVKAIGYSELLRLSRKDLMMALTEYPNAKQILEQQAKERCIWRGHIRRVTCVKYYLTRPKVVSNGILHKLRDNIRPIRKMQKTKEVRRTSADDDDGGVSPTCTPDDPKPAKRKDLFLQVIKSPNFQKLISSRHNDVKELKGVIAELKQFDSQSTKTKFEKLELEKEGLESKLKEKDHEVMKIKRKYAKAVARYNAKFAELQLKGTYVVNEYFHNYSKESETGNYQKNGLNSTVVDYTSNRFGQNISHCLFQEVHPNLRPKLQSKVFMHSTKRSTPKDNTPCKGDTRVLKHSISAPNISRKNDHNIPASVNIRRTISHPQKREINPTSSTNGDTKYCSKHNNPQIEVIDTSSEQANVNATQTNSSNDVAFEKGLMDLEQLLTFDNCGTMSDFSGTDSDESSDANTDYEFESS